jgi:hypothetical protein
MKLTEIVESQFQSDIYPYEPSGNAGPTTVDSDKFADRTDGRSRAKKLRKKWTIAKIMRSPVNRSLTVKDYNTDLTGSGAHSVLNAPYK